ncbi:hypothetical protein SAY87_012858 [Trapa incisa]|uniref:Exostosin GT47 domain-containing protein n=1 Tax=Trapa incisa TaxID=236973 RepID=A0AAN7GI14_9MYRT|nr:hypothetical protein SAY87_012858 [Trapa incisa]
MARTTLLLYYTRRRFSNSSARGFSFVLVPSTLALITTLLILFYVFTTSTFFSHHHPHRLRIQRRRSDFGPPINFTSPPSNTTVSSPSGAGREAETENQQAGDGRLATNGGYGNNTDVFHNRHTFLEDYEQMNKSFKIYVYPHRKSDPFKNILEPVDFKPGGNYASESYFKKVLFNSHFITKNPSRADLFFMPFSITRLRHDPRIGVRGVRDFVRDYVYNISHEYPYWNRTGGTDHFYVACHSIGRSAMEKAEWVKWNAIQVVCSSSYFLAGYLAHKDASLPQVWPREGDPPNLTSSKRNKLAFFAGGINSPVREKLLQVWGNDTEIFAHYGRLKTPYGNELLGSKFCLHVKGYEVNTARIADSLYYGCVPVIIANHYDLPFTDVLNWKSFSIVVATLDIPLLKRILKGVDHGEYSMLWENVMEPLQVLLVGRKIRSPYFIFRITSITTAALLSSDSLGKLALDAAGSVSHC